MSGHPASAVTLAGGHGNAWETSIPQAVALDQSFDPICLPALRATVAAHAANLGLSGDRLHTLVLVANELATNAIRHGSGRGRLRIWRDGDAVYCQVSDDGRAEPSLSIPAQRPPPHQIGGRGLWLIGHLCDRADITVNGHTVATVAVKL